jgi:DNA polymerase
VTEAVAEARRLAAEAGSLEALAAAIDGFEGCPLRHEGGRRSVFARGVPDAAVMVIGEAPDADDEQHGEPFAGRVGRMLDRMLAAVDLRDAAFVTNTVFWRPPGNRSPSPEEQAVCAPFLERAVALVRPKVLLLMGATSVRSVLKRNEGILALRGKWLDWSLETGGGTFPVLPTFHPAFLISRPEAKKKAWSDLLSLAERLDRMRA